MSHMSRKTVDASYMLVLLWLAMVDLDIRVLKGDSKALHCCRVPLLYSLLTTRKYGHTLGLRIQITRLRMQGLTGLQPKLLLGRLRPAGVLSTGVCGMERAVTFFCSASFRSRVQGFADHTQKALIKIQPKKRTRRTPVQDSSISQYFKRLLFVFIRNPRLAQLVCAPGRVWQ